MANTPKTTRSFRASGGATFVFNFNMVPMPDTAPGSGAVAGTAPAERASAEQSSDGKAKKGAGPTFCFNFNIPVGDGVDPAQIMQSVRTQLPLAASKENQPPPSAEKSSAPSAKPGFGAAADAPASFGFTTAAAPPATAPAAAPLGFGSSHAPAAPVAAAADAKPAGLGAFGFAAASGPPSLDPYLHVACMSQSGPGAHSHRETLFGCRAARACS